MVSPGLPSSLLPPHFSHRAQAHGVPVAFRPVCVSLLSLCLAVSSLSHLFMPWPLLLLSLHARHSAACVTVILVVAVAVVGAAPLLRFSPFLMACYNRETETFESVCRVMSGFTDAFYAEVRAHWRWHW